MKSITPGEGAEIVSASGNWWHNLFEELKRRRVFRVATLYVVAFWPLIQIVDILSPALELPDAVMRYLVIAFVAGFPVALVLAWIFDLNKEGVTVTGTPQDSETPMVGGRSEIIVVAVLLVLVAGLFTVQIQQSNETQTPTPVDQRSVAVLPFASFSTNPADQQFADGLTEELLNVLAHVKSLRVAARTSSFAYKGVNKDVRVIGQELGVGVILEGSVRRNDIDNTIRVTAQLVDASTGDHFFSKTYDRQFTDIFKIQDDIASSVVEELQITLLGDEKEKIQSRASANPEAMIAHGMGQAELSKRSRQSLSDAKRFFERATALDPNYLDAFVGIATAEALMVSYGHGSAEDYLPSAQTSLDRAFELDPNSGNAWATQGLIHMQHEDKDSAREALLKAIENNPSHAMAHMWYAGLLDNSKDKLSWYQKAYELDPRSPVIGYNIANIYFARGDEAAAMGFFSRIVEADPHYHSAYMLAATIAHTRGRIEESIAQLKQAYELSPNNNYVVSLTDQYTTLGETDKAREWFALINTDYFPEGFLTYYEWLEINIHLAEDKIEEARKLMSAKVERVSGESSDVAIEDATVASAFLRDLDGTISFYEELDGELDKSHFNNSSRIDAAMAAAYSYGLTGRMEQRDALLDRIEVIIEEFTSENPGSFSGLWVLRSQIATLRGETTMALVHLQRAIDEGFRNSLPLTYAPVFDSIRDESTFMSIMSSLEQRRAMMREQLRMAESFDSDW